MSMNTSDNRGRSYQSRQVALNAIGFASYQDYLKSDLWKLIRRTVYAAKGSECYLCGNPATELHHNRYHKNDLLGKKLKYINPICRQCHQSIEFRNGTKATVSEASTTFRKIRRDYLS